MGGGGGEAEGGEVVDDPVGAGLPQLGIGSGGAQGEDAGACGLAGANAGGGVFDDDAVGGSEAENLGGFEVGLGIGLAALDVVGGDEISGEREAGGADADFGQPAGAGSGDGPAILRESLQDFESAGEGNHAFNVRDFAAFDFAIFRFVIGVGQQLANGGDAGLAVSLADDFARIEAVLVGPDGPDARDGRGGVDEDAVEIEQDAAAMNFHGFSMRLLT